MLGWMREHLKDDEYMLWREGVEKPPPGVEPETGAWSDEEMMRQFQSFKSV